MGKFIFGASTLPGKPAEAESGRSASMSFKKNPKITTPADPGTDKTLPKPGANIPLNVIHLKKQSIEYVNGSADQTVVEDVTYEVKGNATTKICKDETHTVEEGKLSTTVGGECEFTVMKDYNQTINGEQFNLNVGDHTEVKMNSHMIEKTNETLETHWTPHKQFKSYVLDICSIAHIAVAPAINEGFVNKIEIGGFVEEFLGVKTGAVGLDTAEKGLEHEIHGLESKIGAVKSDIKGLNARVKGLEAGPALTINDLFVLAPNSLAL